MYVHISAEEPNILGIHMDMYCYVSDIHDIHIIIILSELWASGSDPECGREHAIQRMQVS